VSKSQICRIVIIGKVWWKILHHFVASFMHFSAVKKNENRLRFDEFVATRMRIVFLRHRNDGLIFDAVNCCGSDSVIHIPKTINQLLRRIQHGKIVDVTDYVGPTVDVHRSMTSLHVPRDSREISHNLVAHEDLRDYEVDRLVHQQKCVANFKRIHFCPESDP